MINLAYAEADITPENGEDLCGFTLRSKGSHGIHDRLKVKWLALSDAADKTFLLGSADIISVSRNTFNALQAGITSSADIPIAGVGFATSHTHSGPVTVTLRNCGKLNRSYMDRMKQQIQQAATSAAGEKGDPVKLLVGHSTSDEGINRRQGESGPIDRTVTVISFVDQKTRKSKATLVNFACHPVVLGHISNHVSADYPGYLQQYVEEHTGAPCIFINGACGDVNPRHGDHSADPNDARKIGHSVGASAINALQNAVEVPVDQIQWYTRTVQLPVYQPKSEAELEDRLDMIHKCFGLDRNLFADRVQRDKRLLADGRYPETVALQLSFMALGSALGILFVPGELFASLGLKFKELFASRQVIISAFSNGSVGYLPDRKAYADGGYEPHFANFFYDFPQFDPSLEDALLDGVAALAKTVNHAEAMKSA